MIPSAPGAARPVLRQPVARATTGCEQHSLFREVHSISFPVCDVNTIEGCSESMASLSPPGKPPRVLAPLLP